jgi:hypothetical protein
MAQVCPTATATSGTSGLGRLLDRATALFTARWVTAGSCPDVLVWTSREVWTLG